MCLNAGGRGVDDDQLSDRPSRRTCSGFGCLRRIERATSYEDLEDLQCLRVQAVLVVTKFLAHEETRDFRANSVLLEPYNVCSRALSGLRSLRFCANCERRVVLFPLTGLRAIAEAARSEVTTGGTVRVRLAVLSLLCLTVGAAMGVFADRALLQGGISKAERQKAEAVRQSFAAEPGVTGTPKRIAPGLWRYHLTTFCVIVQLDAFLASPDTKTAGIKRTTGC